MRLFTLSGSPFGWKTHLALLHKGLNPDVRYLSVSAGDTARPWFLALNPHGKLPVFQDGALTLYESDAILAYLEEAYPAPSLWPEDLRERAMARRVALEASAYLYPPLRAIVARLDQDDVEAVAAAEAPRIYRALERFAETLSAGFCYADRPGAADYAVYPLFALRRRLSRKLQALAPLVAALTDWSGAIEATPRFAETVPPHWTE